MVGSLLSWWELVSAAQGQSHLSCTLDPMKLTPIEQWMVKSNLETIQAGTPVEQQVAILKANGYLIVAAAVKLAWERKNGQH